MFKQFFRSRLIFAASLVSATWISPALAQAWEEDSAVLPSRSPEFAQPISNQPVSNQPVSNQPLSDQAVALKDAKHWLYLGRQALQKGKTDLAVALYRQGVSRLQVLKKIKAEEIKADSSLPIPDLETEAELQASPLDLAIDLAKAGDLALEQSQINDALPLYQQILVLLQQADSPLNLREQTFTADPTPDTQQPDDVEVLSSALPVASVQEDIQPVVTAAIAASSQAAPKVDAQSSPTAFQSSTPPDVQSRSQDQSQSCLEVSLQADQIKCYENALAAAEQHFQAGRDRLDLPLAADALLEMGQAYLGLGRAGQEESYRKAEQAFQDALKRFTELEKIPAQGRPDGKADALVGLANAYLQDDELQDDELQKTRAIAQQALEITQQLTDAATKARLQMEVGDIYYALEQTAPEPAMPVLINPNTADSCPVADSEPQQSIALYQQSLSFWNGQGDRPQEEASVLRRLVSAYTFQRCEAEAIEYHKQIPDVVARLPDGERRRANALLELGHAYLSLRTPQGAIDAGKEFERAQRIFESLDEAAQLKDPSVETGQALLGQSRAKFWQGNDLSRQEAIHLARQARSIFEENENQAGIAQASDVLANAYFSQNQFDEGFQSLNQVLDLSRGYLGDQTPFGHRMEDLRLARGIFDALSLFVPGLSIVRGIATTLAGLDEFGTFYQRDLPLLLGNQSASVVRDQFKRAAKNYETALENAQTDAEKLKYQLGLGQARLALHQYGDAEDVLKDALKLAEKLDDRDHQAQAHLLLSEVDSGRGEFEDAQTHARAARDLYQTLQASPETAEALLAARAGEAGAWATLGRIAFSQGNYEGSEQSAQSSAQRAFDLYQELIVTNSEYAKSQAYVRLVLGRVELQKRRYQPALEQAEAALLILEKAGDWAGRAEANLLLADAQRNLGSYDEAMQAAQQARLLFKDIGDRPGEARSLVAIGYVLQAQNQLQQAYTALELSSGIQEDEKKRAELMARPRDFLGQIFDWAWRGLGLLGGGFARSLQQAVGLADSVLNIVDQGAVRTGMASTLLGVGDYSAAKGFYEEALKIAKKSGDKAGQAEALLGLSNACLSFTDCDNYEKAVERAHSAIKLFREVGDRDGEAWALVALSYASTRAGQDSKDPAEQQALYQQAQESAEQALGFFRTAETQDPLGEALAFTRLGDLWVAKNQPDVAIVFYKQAVNLQEEIGRSVPTDRRRAYANTLLDSYRRLIDQLLAQKRVLAAQQILELLKREELKQLGKGGEFLSDAASAGRTTTLGFNPLESSLLTAHEALINAVQQTISAEPPSVAAIKPELARQQFQTALEEFLSQTSRTAAGDKDIVPPEFIAKAEEIVAMQPNTLLIYPIVQRDGLRLLWVASGGDRGEIEVRARERAVSQRELTRAVLKLRELLTSPKTDLDQLRQLSQQLYGWLIQPLEDPENGNILQARGIQHLVFAPDQVTRYVPMAALFDGNQYLIQRYPLSTILSAELTDTDVSDRLPAGIDQTSILALGLARPVPKSDSLPFLDALGTVPDELDQIVSEGGLDRQGIYPGLALLDEKFDRSAFNNLNDRQILHIATHGKFLPDSWDSSFLVLGTGEALRIREILSPAIRQNFNSVNLVVLSACQTGLGDKTTQERSGSSTGTEIAGLAYSFVQLGAENVIASLWSVDGNSTRELMTSFYRHLASGTDPQPVSISEALQIAQIRLLSSPATAHPYYWAAFSLTGSGL